MPPEDLDLPARVRAHLQKISELCVPITYQILARKLQLRPPNTIRQVTEALEHLMQEDAANGHPFIAALVIGKAHNGLPAPGYFQMAAHLKRYEGDMNIANMTAHHSTERQAAIDFWSLIEGN